MEKTPDNVINNEMYYVYIFYYIKKNLLITLFVQKLSKHCLLFEEDQLLIMSQLTVEISINYRFY